MNQNLVQYNEERKNFRSYLRKQKGKKGQFLSNLINAAEIHLSRIIRTNIDSSYTIIYDESIELQALVNFYVIIESHDEWLTTDNGYTAWKSLYYFISYRAEQDGIDWTTIYANEIRKLQDKEENDVILVNNNLDKEIKFTEGTIIESHFDTRERNYHARIKCIEYHGCKCAICGFDFNEKYGEIGKDFIEVHHVIPLSETCGEHSVNPITDLIPVCSNCHSMLHRRRPNPYLPEDIKKILK